jgi:hypothetical protein
MTKHVRRFIFVLMIALLPLRGWMGEAMATEMAATYLIASQTLNTSTKNTLTTIKNMSDCDMHASLTADNVDNTTANLSCTHCQACHASGLVGTVQTTSLDKVQYKQPLANTSQFSSANIAHSQKPPIF